MKKRIIAVEDDVSVAPLLEHLLMKQYEIQVEDSCEAALDAALKSPPDLFLLDIRSHGIPGTELAARLAAYECFRSIPIIFISALVQSQAEDGEPVLINGRPAFGKPFDIDVFRTYIAGQLSGEMSLSSRPLKHGFLAGEELPS